MTLTIEWPISSISAGLENTQRLIAANNHAAFQNMVNQQNALRSAAPLGGAPLILSPRLQVSVLENFISSSLMES